MTLAEMRSSSAGDCTLEYDRATGRYYDVADSVKA